MTKADRTSLISQRRFNRVVIACVVLGFLALVGTGVAAALAVLRTEDHARWVEHTYRVEQRVGALRLVVERLEVTRRGYLLAAVPRFRDNFRTLVAAEPGMFAELRRSVADNPRELGVLAQIERAATTQARLLGASIEARDRDPDSARALFATDDSVPTTRVLRRLLDRMTGEEQRLLDIRTRAQRSSTRELYVLLVICAVLLVAVAILSVTVIRRYTRDLLRSRNALSRLNDTLEERVQARTGELSRANDEIQRFAYIVSHDLRSPLVNVMGFTGELEAASRPLAALVDAAEADAPAILTAEARLAAREDLPESIGFIRSSTQKMDRLINAILRLSREGRRNLSPEPIDLAALTDSIVATLRHRLDELGAEVAVERPMPPLRADRLAVEQILSNLVENSVKYLKPGVPGRVRVSARMDQRRVAITVADNGRGIDPRDHERIFDLFRRSGQQDQPGEGIGLAHVRALAYRLGGLVDCRSELGEGAAFTLSLPPQPIVSQG